MTAKLGLSLASKLLIASVLIIVGISVLFWLPSIVHIQKEELNKNVNFAESQMDVIQRALYYGMLTNNREFIKQTIESLASMDNILWIRITDSKGNAHFSSVRDEVSAWPDSAMGNVRDKERRTSMMKEVRGQRVFEIIQPIHNVHPCYTAKCHAHPKDQKILGRIETGYSLRSVDAYISKQKYTLAAFGFVFISVLFVPLYLIVQHFVLSPVALLKEGIQRVTAGDLSHSIEIDTKDELGMLAKSFNSMTRKLEEKSNAVTKELDEYRTSLLHAQKMEAMGTLSAGIAHDFNNILTGILGYSELALEETTHQPVKEYLQRVLDLTQNATEFTKQILFIGRKLPPTSQPIDITQVVADSMRVLRRMVEENIEIRLIPQAGLHTVNADQAQISQVLMNLVVNARDAMPKGGVIEIRTGESHVDEEYCAHYAYAAQGHFVTITVSDTGDGISEEIRTRIFEPFFTTKLKGKGTGLGLAVSYSIVKAHGGWIHFYSEEGKGTAFTIYLPAFGPGPDTVVNSREVSQKQALPKGKECILLVDDEEVIRDLGESILRGLGYEVVTASNGEEALRVYKERCDEIALVIMDRVMPKIDGIESYKLLKGINPHVRVIISSGYAADEALNLKELGVLGFLDKPYRMAEMARMVRRSIDRGDGESG
jgi:signal transduction histidine kinase/CheY-like chemotaxis protein